MEVERPAVTVATPVTDEATSTGGSDLILIPAHVFCPEQKATGAVDFTQLSKCLLAPEDNAANTAATEYASALSNARAALVANLASDSATVAEADVDAALQKYIALLLGLLNRYPQGAGRGSSAGGGEGAAASSIPGDSALRSALTFTWQDALHGKDTVAARDAVFELASVIAAAGLWKMRQASRLCTSSGAQIPADAAVKAHKILRAAVGLFSFAATQCSNLLFNSVPSVDVHPEVLKAYELVALADAQAISVLRAIQKGNTASLVSSIAADTADLYRQSAAAAARAPSAAAAHPAGAAPVAAYASWKALAFDAYALTFAGRNLMSEKGGAKQEAGKAVRLLNEAQAQLAAADDAAGKFEKLALGKDAAKKRGRTRDHEAFNTALRECVNSSHAKIKRENDVIYYQRVPLELPERPAPQRLVNATPYVLPAPASVVTEGVLSCFGNTSPAPTAEVVPALPRSTAAAATTSDGKTHPSDDATPQEASCWRWTLVVIAAPFLVIISVVGAVIWLLLLPVKIICCPLGCAAQVVWNAVEWGLKAPFRALLWASGKPWRPTRDPDPEAPPVRHAHAT